jgi:hypothetical protein
MSQKHRIGLGVLMLLLLVGAVLGIDALQRARSEKDSVGEVVLTAGSVPIYLDGKLVAGFQPTDLEHLAKVSFVDPAEGKTQEGWLLRDVLLLHIKRSTLKATMLISVSSSSRSKSAQVTWAEADDTANWVMFDLAGRGTLKLVSVMDKLDSRDEWVQDVDRIEVTNP